MAYRKLGKDGESREAYDQAILDDTAADGHVTASGAASVGPLPRPGRDGVDPRRCYRSLGTCGFDSVAPWMAAEDLGDR